MKLLDTISGWWGKRASTIAGSSLKDPSKWLVDFFGGQDTATGIQIHEDNALQNTAVLAAVRAISETVASLPLNVYKRLPGGGKEKAVDHPLFKLLHVTPNPEMSSMQFRETLQLHLLTWGNAYAEIQFNNAGQPIALWPLTPNRVTPRRINDDVVFQVFTGSGAIGIDDKKTSTGSEFLPMESVIHLRGLSRNGLVGMSPIQMAREAIALGIATEKFGSAFFGNRADPGGILEHPGQLSDKAYNRLKTSWEGRHRGLSNAQRMTILEEGMKWTRIGVPPDDAQFLETRKFQVNEIARIYRIPPHMIGDLDRATFSNVEQQSIDFVVHTIRPWLVRWEQEMLMKLVAPEEQTTIFIEHLVDGLLRGDSKTRHEGYAIGRQWGYLSADDVRAMENMNPLPDGQGEMYFVPMNMIPADKAEAMADAAIAPEPEPTEEEINPPEEDDNDDEDRTAKAVVERRAATNRRRVEMSFRGIFRATADRVLRREKNDVLRLVKKNFETRNEEAFDAALEKFYIEHREFVAKEFMPAMQGLSDALAPVAAEEVGQSAPDAETTETFVRAYADTYAVRHTKSSEGQIRQVVKKAIDSGKDVFKAAEARFKEWEEKRGEKIAKRETVQEGSAVTKNVWRVVGVIKFRWLTFGDNCPYCDSLGGRTVGIQENFANAGDSLNPESAQGPMRMFGNIGHPPLHQGCDCTILPG